MKQIDICLDRFFQKKEPLRRKWVAVPFYKEGYIYPDILHLYHYHHTVLIYDTKNHKILYKWWEKQADKRGLDSALHYLNNLKESGERNT